MSEAKPEDFFPELNIHILRVQAERWAKRFPEAPINRILLYGFSSKYEALIINFYARQPLPIIYAIVFELDIEDKTCGISSSDQLKYDLDGINGKRVKEPYERLMVATKPNKRIADNEQYYELLTQDFMKVYKHPPKPEYRQEWHFCVNFKNTVLSDNIRTDEPHIVLWPQEKENEKNEGYNSQYIFRETGPTWEIHYENKHLIGLKGKGFPYIQYLVRRQNKEFHVRELDIAIHGSNPEAEYDRPKRVVLENDDTEGGYSQKDHAAKKGLDVNSLADPKTFGSLKQELNDLEMGIEEAKDLQHTQKAEELMKERDDILKYFSEYFYTKGGKTMHFRDESIKQKDRICKSIQRAIDSIAKHDLVTATHFQRALSPVNSFSLSYTPDRNIDWSTD